MTERVNPLTLDDADRTFSVLTESLERLVAAWESGGKPPNIGDFVTVEGEMRRIVLSELVKVDLEYRWSHRRQPKYVRDYVFEFPELRDGGIPVDLLYEEYHLRKQNGDAVKAAEYLEEYPECANELQRLLGLAEPYASTALIGRESLRRLEDLDVGQEIDDFHLLTLLGKGAFASVFLARQKSMQRMVALKISSNQGMEPQTLAQLDHDYIVRVFDQRIVEDGQLRLLYMQYFPGGTLQQVVEHVRGKSPHERMGRLLLECVDTALIDKGEARPTGSSDRATLAASNWSQAVCWIGSRIALALDGAHRVGILHRDLKPANVLLSAEGVPKLADFNIAFSSKVSGATPAAYFGGSLAYMSPEQLEACNPGHEREPESLDGRSDLYSLGVMLWELLTGERPFEDKVVKGSWSRTLHIMTRSRRETIGPEQLARLPADCPTGLKNAMLKCLEPDRDRRWSSGAELAQQLEISRSPLTHDRVFPSESSVWTRGRRYIFVILALLIVFPNAVAGVFNYVYNFREIVRLYPENIAAFERIQTVINSIAFPLGVGLGSWMAWAVVSGMKRALRGEKLDEERLRWLRRRCLRMGHFGAMIGVVEWTVAGIAYPVALYLFAPVTMNWQSYVHFFPSLILCGLIVAAYPFFLVTWVMIRMVYPPLLQANLTEIDDSFELDLLSRRSTLYLWMAMSVPLLSVAMLVLIGPEQTGAPGTGRSFARIAMGILSFGGLLGVGLAFWLYRQLQGHIEALRPAVGHIRTQDISFKAHRTTPSPSELR